MSEEIDLNLFVYGSLVPGGEYWGRFCEGKVVARRKARVWGRLFRSREGYLALALAEERSALSFERLPVWIPGWVLTLRDGAALRAIDGLEGYAEGRAEEKNDYQRVRVACYAPGGEAEPEALGEAWCYVMTAGQLTRAGAATI